MVVIYIFPVGVVMGVCASFGVSCVLFQLFLESQLYLHDWGLRKTVVISARVLQLATRVARGTFRGFGSLSVVVHVSIVGCQHEQHVKLQMGKKNHSELKLCILSPGFSMLW